jgi:NACHT domain-containing protein
VAAGFTPAAQLKFDHITVGGDFTLRDVTIRQHFGESRRTDLASRNRRAMIEKVWAMWITGVLQPSLPHDILLDLGLTERPVMVTRALDLLVQRPDLADRVQAPGTRLVEIFDRLDRALLILGAPGAGKTTLLLTLGQDLLIRAAQNPEQPIPVVFPLSSWAERRRPLDAWLVDALNEQYDVPRKTGQAWVDTDQVLPLLDGLDEVNAEHRAACVEAINRFRQEHGLLPLVVCSRIADYEALGTQLRLQGALVVQPLTPQQVEDYLAQVGRPVAAVRQALQKDPMLWELLDTPLMLTVVSLAYGGQPTEALRTHETLESKRQHLLAAYVDGMFLRRGIMTRPTPRQTIEWLAWLARQMTQYHQTTFYLEQMQPDWLPQGQRWLSTIGVALGVGLVMILGSFLVHGRNLILLMTGQWPTRSTELAERGLDPFWWPILIGGFTMLCYGLIPGLFAYAKTITSVEVIRWSWSAATSGFLSTLKVGLYGVVLLLGVGAVVGPIPGLWLKNWPKMFEGWWAGLITGAIRGLILWAFLGVPVGIIRGVFKGLSRGEIGIKTIPNQGIYRSARTALIGALL